MKLITSAYSRKNGITFYGNTYKVEMNEKKDGSIEYVQKKLPAIERQENKKFSSIFLLRGICSFFRLRTISILWIITVIYYIILNLNTVPKNSINKLSLIIAGLLVLIVVLSTNNIYGNLKNIFLYHGAEHKIIHALNKDMELTLKNIRIQPCYNNSCGSILVCFFITVYIIFSLFTSYSLLFFPIIYSISFEMFCVENGENLPILKWFYKFGKFIQEKFLTKEPTDKMILDSIEAVRTLINLETTKSK